MTNFQTASPSPEGWRMGVVHEAENHNCRRQKVEADILSERLERQMPDMADSTLLETGELTGQKEAKDVFLVQ
jgi:hypothetical protein